MNRIIEGDAKDLPIEDDTTHLVVTSPPYNLGVAYDEHDDELPIEEYGRLLKSAFRECHRALVPGGRLCVVVGLGAGVPCDDKPRVVSDAARAVGFDLRDKFIWDKGTSESSSAWGSWRSPSNPREIFQHEEILVFYKDRPGRPDKSGQTISKPDFLDCIKSVWQVNPVSDPDHPAAFPTDIPRRLIKLYSFPDDVVLDPFAGSGTTCLAAKRLGRRFIGVELSPEYVAVAQRRVGTDVDEPERLLKGGQNGTLASVFQRNGEAEDR